MGWWVRWVVWVGGLLPSPSLMARWEVHAAPGQQGPMQRQVSTDASSHSRGSQLHTQVSPTAAQIAPARRQLSRAPAQHDC